MREGFKRGFDHFEASYDDIGNSVPAPAPIRPDPGGYPARSGKVDVHLIGTASMAAAQGESPQGHGRGVGRRPREL